MNHRPQQQSEDCALQSTQSLDVKQEAIVAQPTPVGHNQAYCSTRAVHRFGVLADNAILR